MASLHHGWFATVPRGMERLLARELHALGAERVREGVAGVRFRGDLATAYRACLHSRLASRVVLQLAAGPVADPEALYTVAVAVPWEEHIPADGTLAVAFTGTGHGIRNTQFGAQRVKDAIVDRIRARHGSRPGVDLRAPQVRVTAHLAARGELSLGIDLTVQPLHHRGYRVQTTVAPLRENLAAAILLYADWPQRAAAGGTLVDPLCGSGTFLVEGALMAAAIAPGLLSLAGGPGGRWLGHDPGLWARLVDEARDLAASAAGSPAVIRGYDRDPEALAAARANLAAAGLGDRVHLEARDVRDQPRHPDAAGLVVVNPPYGERIGNTAAAAALRRDLVPLLARAFPGWGLALFDLEDGRRGQPPGLERPRRFRLYNGAIPCELHTGTLAAATTPAVEPAALDPAATDFANRLRKNLGHLGRWARRAGIDCYRLYDADLPDYALAIDLYHTEAGPWVQAQEYAPPKQVDEVRAAARRDAALAVLGQVLELPPERVVYKVRQRQRGSAQYQRRAREEAHYPVREGGYRFEVNLTDYLDTGLFLDHRLVRALLGDLARGRRFLNLYAYTGTATVYAAGGGARETTSVDLSPRYLEWTRRNLELNGLGGRRHRLVEADCGEWLEEAARAARGGGARYDLIFLDPPTFSNSKRTARDLSVQRDHPELIRRCMDLLSPEGLLVFSTNARRFRLDPALAATYRVSDITRATLPEDFQRNPRIHGCWRIAHGEGV